MTLDLSLLPDGGMSWLEASGPENVLVLSTRIRLARNLQAQPFPGRASDDQRRAIMHDVLDAGRTSPVLASAATVEVDRLTELERLVLHERHLVSKELAGIGRASGSRAAAGLLTTGELGIMVNEEDHLRMQSLVSGFALADAYSRLERLDSDLGGRLPIAFHPEFGYLTACPTNTGTGLRASVLMHLPGLVLTKEIAKVLQGLSHVGLTFRGLYGEGSEVVGNFFQLSNQTTLGKSEEELLDHLGKMVEQVLVWERQARTVLQREAATVIEDKVWRAYAWLRYARRLPFDEAMNLLSGVRLGVGLNLISDVSVYTLNKLLIYTQPANLALQEGMDQDDPELDVRRATYVRTLLDGDAGRHADDGGA
jgi:protein arginine kinase